MTQSEIDKICKRVKEKREIYIDYDFSRIQNDILKTFFDLAQEFDSLRDFFAIAVLIPLEFLKVDCRLYLFDDNNERLELVCDSQKGHYFDRLPAPEYIQLVNEPYEANDSYILPIFGKSLYPASLPVYESHNLIGMFELFPESRLRNSDRFFLTKYTNRIGYNLHNRKIARQNINHIKFINTLVRDIEHDVIIPNMYYRFLFIKFGKKVAALEELEDSIGDLKNQEGRSAAEVCDLVVDKLGALREELFDLQSELQRHHSFISMFLESLFRRDHFEQGQLVLRPKKCIVGKEIVVPQLAHFGNRLKSQGITIEHSQEMATEEVPLLVDIGLLSQVYANLISNAVKYTTEIRDQQGRSKKALAYGRDVLSNFFGPGRDGIKFNVFTTGKHIEPPEVSKIFCDGFRGSNIHGQPGTGHGLSFVRSVVELHGGKVGYDPTEQGNNFYFILPLTPQKNFC